MREKMKRMIETVTTKKKKLIKLHLAIYVMADITTAHENASTGEGYVVEEETTKLKTATMETRKVRRSTERRNIEKQRN